MKTYTFTEEEFEIEKCRLMLENTVEEIAPITAEYISKKYYKNIHEVKEFAIFFTYYWRYVGQYFFEKKYNFDTQKNKEISDDYIKKFEKLVDKKFKEFIKIMELDNFYKEQCNISYDKIYIY